MEIPVRRWRVGDAIGTRQRFVSVYSWRWVRQSLRDCGTRWLGFLVRRVSGSTRCNATKSSYKGGRMSKDEGVRITDTINFIRTATVPAAHNAQRATVADLLRDYDAHGHIADTVSPAMSQGSNYAILGRDEVKASRHYRRAIILIRMALENADRSVAPRDVSQISDANLPNEQIGRAS